MKKYGFTLTELLAVIAIIGVLVIAIVPNVIKTYNNGIEKTFEQQKNNVADAANLFVQDYCTRKISTDYTCPSTYVTEHYVCLNTLELYGYIKGIEYKNSKCRGMVMFDSNNKNPKTYLYCGSKTPEDGTQIKSDCDRELTE